MSPAKKLKPPTRRLPEPGPRATFNQWWQWSRSLLIGRTRADILSAPYDSAKWIACETQPCAGCKSEYENWRKERKAFFKKLEVLREQLGTCPVCNSKRKATK